MIHAIKKMLLESLDMPQSEFLTEDDIHLIYCK